jgi:hypothetical protein
MTTDYNCITFVNVACMAFSRFRFPSSQAKFLVLNFVRDVFCLSLNGRLFDDLTNFSIESRQVFFFIFIQVEQVLVPETFFNII